MQEKEEKLFQDRLNRVNSAISLQKTDRVPVCLMYSSWIQRSEGSSYRDIYYDYQKAGEAALKFYQKNPMLDAAFFGGFTSGKANELAQSQMIDWPGRPGTLVSDYSSHQVIEKEFMTQEEYPEMLNDFTGFMLRKYIPRAFPALKGLESVALTPTIVLSTSLLSPLYGEGIRQAYKVLGEIADADKACAEATAAYTARIQELGFPPMITGASEAPYDILGDYFRGTMGIFEDLTDDDMQEYMERACDLFADQQIAALQYFRYVDLPVKRVFFPLHKAMDGFMNEEQFERLYWKPLKKIVLALIDMGVTPYLYTEGAYNTRLDFLTDVPKGKVLYHFEKTDMQQAKKKLNGIACICGNLPISQIEFGKKETVEKMTRSLLEDCMPGGGYIFDFDGSLENAKPENLDIMYETLDKYGRYA